MRKVTVAALFKLWLALCAGALVLRLGRTPPRSVGAAAEACTGCAATRVPSVCSHRGAGAPGLEPGSIRAIRALLHAGISCFDMDLVATRDGALLVGHPTYLRDRLWRALLQPASGAAAAAAAAPPLPVSAYGAAQLQAAAKAVGMAPLPRLDELLGLLGSAVPAPAPPAAAASAPPAATAASGGAAAESSPYTVFVSLELKAEAISFANAVAVLEAAKVAGLRPEQVALVLPLDGALARQLAAREATLPPRDRGWHRALPVKSNFGGFSEAQRRAAFGAGLPGWRPPGGGAAAARAASAAAPLSPYTLVMPSWEVACATGAFMDRLEREQGGSSGGAGGGGRNVVAWVVDTREQLATALRAGAGRLVSNTPVQVAGMLPAVIRAGGCAMLLPAAVGAGTNGLVPGGFRTAGAAGEEVREGDGGARRARPLR